MHAVAVARPHRRRVGPRVRDQSSASPGPSRRHPPLHDVLALQRSAGNSAVTRLLAQRSERGPLATRAHYAFDEGTAAAPGPVAVQGLAESEKTENLRSEKYAGDTRLEAAFDNSPPMRIGESGEPVRLVQEGLVADGHPMPVSTRPDGQLDGIFGAETDRAVRDFQIKYGLTDANGFADGRVGRRTMGMLDELAGTGPPDGELPECPILGDDTDTFALAGAPGVVGAPLIPGVTCQLKTPPPKPEELCGSPCGPQWIQVKPGLFVSLCDDRVSIKPPLVRTGGCSPGRPGNVGFFTGSPAWQLTGDYRICGKDDPTIQVGFVQTVQFAIHGSSYRDAKTGVDSLGHRECVANARDCVGAAPAPWYDAPGNNFGPQPFGTFPLMVDTPHLPPVTSRIDTRRLQTMSFQGLFHVWLVARLANGTIVFIHHWDIGLGAFANLSAGADPCSISAWQAMGGAGVLSKGAGAGSATPVLTGACAGTLAKPC